MKTILLTGATGYLGGYLSRAFLNAGYSLIAFCLNHNETFNFSKEYSDKVKTYFLDTDSLERIFDENKIDFVVHTATLYGRNNEQLTTMIQANLEFPLKILTLAIKNNVKCFVNTDTILQHNISPYAMTKSQFAEWLDYYSDKIKVINMKLDHFYGPHDKPVKFVAWLVQQLKNNVPEINLTEGSQTRDFIYVEDVARAFLCVINNEAKIPAGVKNDFEVGTGSVISIKEFVLLLQNLIGNTVTRLNFGAIPYRKNEVLTYRVNTAGLQTLGWNPALPVQEGLSKLVNEEMKK